MAAKGFWHFVWNSERKAFMGRTASSWLKILLFYLILYVFLAMFFATSIRIMMLFLEGSNKPVYKDRVEFPGLSHTPRSKKLEISFNINKPATYEKYTSAIKGLLTRYEDEHQTEKFGKFVDCGDKVGQMRDSLDRDEEEQKEACRFSKSWLGDCSGLNDDDTFGFRDGKPCLIVKLNQVVGYTPKAPESASLPEALRDDFDPNRIPIHCTNKMEEDEDKIVEIKYFGFGSGFPLQYYPYYGKNLQPHYLQPLVGVKFDVAMNKPVHLVCKVYAGDIDYSDKDRYQGRFDVKLRISNESGEKTKT